MKIDISFCVHTNIERKHKWTVNICIWNNSWSESKQLCATVCVCIFGKLRRNKWFIVSYMIKRYFMAQFLYTARNVWYCISELRVTETIQSNLLEYIFNKYYAIPNMLMFVFQSVRKLWQNFKYWTTFLPVEIPYNYKIRNQYIYGWNQI